MRGEWEALFPALEPERRRAVEFLYTHLPESDLDCYPLRLFLQFVDHALSLRGQAPWCAQLEEEIFYHYVLFPRVNDEDLSFHREIFFAELWPRVRDIADGEERILEVNRWCHEQASYQLQDERTASPLTVYRSGSGRCGEESAFLVSALRAVGIPARQVYAPRWSHCDDNHAWVEALCGGRWRFLGACEPEPVLDRGWFNTAASRALLVHSRLFGEGTSPLHGTLLAREGGVYWYNQTARYAKVRTVTFRALREGKPAPGTAFQIQVLNAARFWTLAVLTAGADGCARAELGLGDFRVLAELDGLWAEADCAGAEAVVELAPLDRGAETDWRDFDMRPPQDAPVNPAPLDAGQRAARAKTLEQGTALRLKKLSAFQADDHGAWAGLLQAARGNAAEIAAFLKRGGESEALLRSLTDKDLRDAEDAVLADHLENAVNPDGYPPELYIPYILCPRIGLEKLTPWRSTFRRLFTPEEEADFRRDPADLWVWLEDRVRIDAERTYKNLVWTPLEALESGRCDERSFFLLYTAMLRAIGVPARLRARDGEPECWTDGRFWSPRLMEIVPLCLTAGEETPPYGQGWTVEQRNSRGWSLLSFSEEDWRNQRLWLTDGQYRMTTSVRLPNGSQFASERVFTLMAGRRYTLPAPRFRTYDLEDMLGAQEMPPTAAVTMDGTEVPDIWRLDGRPALLFWLEEGGEPTEHVLNELAAKQRELEALPVNIVFLLRSRESAEQATLAGVLARWGGIQVLLDDWAYDLEGTARRLSQDPDQTPLAVAVDSRGRAVYASGGYRVGSVDLLWRVAAALT